MKKIIGITSQNEKRITKHAGKCDTFLVYTIEQSKILKKEVLKIDKQNTLHSIFHEIGNENISPVFDFDVLLTGSIGPGAIVKLSKKNVEAHSVIERNPDQAILDYINGTLEVYEFQHDKEHNCNHNVG